MGVHGPRYVRRGAGLQRGRGYKTGIFARKSLFRFRTGGARQRRRSAGLATAVAFAQCGGARWATAGWRAAARLRGDPAFAALLRASPRPTRRRLDKAVHMKH
ncbi:hypothetical protein LEN_4403 [Lysobacter enzymogenes]|uniref:Uncharacterized protein n=1 Tax=Lysobacter enzymogenes TaxID=69 RepID=A0AAU9B0Z0_LYSEN|nr:hypothetical protein LEN_4403 [Lysobacter enzymogenes]